MVFTVRKSDSAIWRLVIPVAAEGSSSRGTFGFADGAQETGSATTPCHPAPRPRLAVRPRSRTVRLHVSVTYMGNSVLQPSSTATVTVRVRR